MTDIDVNETTSFFTLNTTTAKLSETLDDLSEQNRMWRKRRDGNLESDETAPFHKVKVLQVTHIGGRDWTILACHLVPHVPMFLSAERAADL